MKKWFLIISKYLGLFSVSEFIYRNHLNILCYHGFSYRDEHLFRPSLFMRSEVLETRLSWLNHKGFRAVSLDEGVRLLKEGVIPPRTIVITIDDGFRSTLDLAAPLFKKYNFPATVYVTSYYAEKELPIFRLAIQYYAWKFGQKQVEIELFSRLPEMKFKNIMDGVVFSEKNMEEAQRVQLARDIAANFGENYDQLRSDGLMSLMTAEEIANISSYGIEVQLHTHRHRLPIDKAGIEEEISQNRDFLEPIVDESLSHFCYPSGIWEPSQLEPLAEIGVQTATTCEPGMNPPNINPLAMKRFLDRDDFEQIEFEAELRGYKELLRTLRNYISRRKDSARFTLSNS